MPIPIDGGRDIALKRNPVTGRYDFRFDDTSNPAFTDSDEHLVLSLLMEYQAKYWADTTGKRGSRLHTVKNARSDTERELEAIVHEALDPAVADGRLRSVESVTATTRASGRYDIEILYRNREGRESNLRIPWSS
jgi:phage gp46-like protein